MKALRLVASLMLASSPALAESAWVTGHGRLVPQPRVEVWAGPRTLGVGLVAPDADARAAWGGELAYSWVDRFFELRGSRQWQLGPRRFATASAQLGGAVYVVPDAALNLGFGPHAGLTLNLGGDAFSVDFGLQSGVDVFIASSALRLPQRALIGVNGRIGPVTLAFIARAGADVVPGHAFIGRGEFVVALGWVVERPRGESVP